MEGKKKERREDERIEEVKNRRKKEIKKNEINLSAETNEFPSGDQVVQST